MRWQAKNSAGNPPKVNRWRSAVSNGRRLFADQLVDGRSSWARRLRDVMALHVADLGGDDAISEAERSIIRRIGTITVEMELLEKRFALSKKGGASPDDITTLSDYLKQHDIIDDDVEDAEDAGVEDAGVEDADIIDAEVLP